MQGLTQSLAWVYARQRRKKRWWCLIFVCSLGRHLRLPGDGPCNWQSLTLRQLNAVYDDGLTSTCALFTMSEKKKEESSRSCRFVCVECRQWEYRRDDTSTMCTITLPIYLERIRPRTPPNIVYPHTSNERTMPSLVADLQTIEHEYGSGRLRRPRLASLSQSG